MFFAVTSVCSIISVSNGRKHNLPIVNYAHKKQLIQVYIYTVVVA